MGQLIGSNCTAIDSLDLIAEEKAVFFGRSFHPSIFCLEAEPERFSLDQIGCKPGLDRKECLCLVGSTFQIPASVNPSGPGPWVSGLLSLGSQVMADWIMERSPASNTSTIVATSRGFCTLSSHMILPPILEVRMPTKRSVSAPGRMVFARSDMVPTMGIDSPGDRTPGWFISLSLQWA
jgi:hypothetical protein